MTDPDEPTMYLVFRDDLKMSRGKVAAQAGHAVQLLLAKIRRVGSEDERAHVATWEAGAYAKVALAVADEAALHAVCGTVENSGILAAMVRDEGRTEFAGPTWTCAAFGPMPKRSVAALNGLRLFR